MSEEVKISELPVADQANIDDLLEASQVEGSGYFSRHISLDQVSTVVANSDQITDVIDAAIGTIPPPTTAWVDITGKPATFPPTVPIAYSDISGKPSTFPPDPEAIDDRVAALLVAGTNVTLNYNDPANTLTINSTSGGGAPTGAAGGDLAGTYPNPLLKPSVTNGQIMTTVAGVSTWAAAPASATLPAGAVGYGGAGNVLTGVLANMSFDATNKRLGVNQATPTAALDIVGQANTPAVKMSGYSLTGSNASSCFSLTGTLNTTGQPDVFSIAITDTSNSGGSAFVIKAGSTAGATIMRCDMAGDLQHSGWSQAMSGSGLPAGGAYYFASYIGNNSGGNVGTYAGLGAPSGLDTFGRYGSIYLNGSSPGVPYYNSNGSTGWTSLAPITAVGTTAPATPVDGQLWYYSDAVNGGGTLYIRYNDGNTTQWVPASPAAAPSTALVTRVQSFLANSTYTPHANMVNGYVVGTGGGGGGGGYQAASSYAVGGGGGASGSVVTTYFTRAQVLPTVAVTIGAAGAGAVSNGAAGSGGDTIFGALLTAKGGGGSPVSYVPGAVTTAGNVGNIIVYGVVGGIGMQTNTSAATIGRGGNGGGPGGAPGQAQVGTGVSGTAATPNSGGGGGGGAAQAYGGAVNGGAGGSGNLYVVEYCTS